jgi:8-oxo-dGTP pyrophosphatase MutT (NUDIX family)
VREEPNLVERLVVRLVLLDPRQRVLLLQTGDLGNPQFGTAWELPGGGMEAGESYVETAVRELLEETGIALAHEQVEQPTWRRDVAYTYRGERRLQHELIALARLDRAAPPVDGSRRVKFESEDLLASRWWPVAEILASDELFYPRSLPRHLPVFLTGQTIEDVFEAWP